MQVPLPEHPGHDITALVLCGGLGTRLRQVVGEVPKALAPIAGRPFLDYQLHILKDQGVKDVILCTGHAADQIEAFCGKGEQWGLRLNFSKETQPLGTAGAIKNAESLVEADRLLILNGDSFLGFELNALIAAQLKQRARLTLALVEVPDRSRYGSVCVSDYGCVTAFGEKGCKGPGLVNGGVYLMQRSVLSEIPGGRALSLEQEVFPQLIGKGLGGIRVSGPFLDIGTPEAYAAAAEFLSRWEWRPK